MSIYKVVEAGLGRVMDITMDGLESMASDRMKEGVSSGVGKVAEVGGIATGASGKAADVTTAAIGKFTDVAKEAAGKAVDGTAGAIGKFTDVAKEALGKATAAAGKVYETGKGVTQGATEGFPVSKMVELGKDSLKTGKNIAKMAGVNLSIATMLRQSQLFTGVVGMIFQVIGAFVDMILIPLIPLIEPVMRLIAFLMPPLVKGAMQTAEDFKYIGGLIGKAWTWTFEFLKKIDKWSMDLIGDIGTWIADVVIKPAWEVLKAEAKEWVATFIEQFVALKQVFWSVWNAMSSWFQNTWDGLVEDFKALPEDVMSILTSVGTFVSGIGTHITDAWGTASTWFTTNIIDKVTGWFDDYVATPIGNAIAAVQNWVILKWQKIKDFVDDIGEMAGWVSEFAGKVGGWIKTGVTTAWDGIKTFFTSTVPEAIKVAFGFVTSKVAAIYEFFSGIIAPIASFVQGVLNKISGYILSIIGFMGNIDRFGIGERVRQTMGFGGTKEDFNRVISQRKMALTEESKKPQEINLIIKQEADTTQQAIRASNIQAQSINLAATRNNDLMLQDGMQ